MNALTDEVNYIFLNFFMKCFSTYTLFFGVKNLLKIPEKLRDIADLSGISIGYNASSVIMDLRI